MEEITAPQRNPQRHSALGWVIVLSAALLFGYDTFEGASNLIGTASSVLAPLLNPGTWVVVILSAVLPVLLFLGALALSWRMAVFAKALVFLVCLATSAALSLTLERLFVVLLLGGV